MGNKFMENWETITRKWRQNAKKTLFPNFVTVGNSESLIGKQVYGKLGNKSLQMASERQKNAVSQFCDSGKQRV